MSVAVHNRAARGAALLLVHCTVRDDEERTPVLERLRAELGADLTHLLLFALAQDHTMRSGDAVAA